LSNRNRVFVVDDDPAVLRSVARLLRRFGYACLPFPSAEAFANHGDFDNAVCVLLDINLGDWLSGIELGQYLKAAALQSGCLAFLTKPFSAKSLIEPLERASAEHI
jgi:FixJ family two-component response regulator